MSLGIEQDRRDLKQCFPHLYEYMEAFITQRALNRAGNAMSNKGELGAANLLWSWSGEFAAVEKTLAQGERDGNGEAVTRRDTL